MKISKKIGALAAALVMSALLTVSLVGCSGSGQDGNNDFMEKGDGEHLVCAVTGKLIKIAPAILADQLGYFEEEGCDVEFQTVALADAMASMSVNKLDIDLFGIVPACSYVSQGIPIYVFGGTILDGSEFISTISFNRDLKTAEDFRGLKIACQREESGQIYLKAYLQDNGCLLYTSIIRSTGTPKTTSTP